MIIKVLYLSYIFYVSISRAHQVTQQTGEEKVRLRAESENLSRREKAS